MTSSATRAFQILFLAALFIFVTRANDQGISSSTVGHKSRATDDAQQTGTKQQLQLSSATITPNNNNYFIQSSNYKLQNSDDKLVPLNSFTINENTFDTNNYYNGDNINEEYESKILRVANGNYKLMNDDDGVATEEDEAAVVAVASVKTYHDPFFDLSTPRNVTALVGKSAYLNCRVRNLGNKTVSWIRHRDIHILTVGSYTYTSDQRFQATHHKETEDWTLQIKWVQKRDGGMYECQVSTQPVQSYFVNLEVVVPTAYIIGGPDLHVDKGSTINLTCSVKYSPEPPAYIFWFHHDEVISYDSNRGGVSVITEKGDVTTSYLLIQNADLADSGKYSCSPSNADVASVRVHVLNGEHPEAMQTGAAGQSLTWLTVLLPLLITIFNQFHNLHRTTRSTATSNLFYSHLITSNVR